MTGVAGALTTAMTPLQDEEVTDPLGAPVIRAVPRPDQDAGPRNAGPPAVEAPAAPSAPALDESLPAPHGPDPDPTGPRRARRTRGSGIRERRRQQTRVRIVDAATELFAERGFDAVSVVEIAQRAGVVEKTVFNHFPVKEGLVFDADPPMRAALLDAVRRRPAGESVAAAAGSFVVAAVSLLGTPEAAEGVAQMARVIRGSRTLLTREREILGELTDSLAALIAKETGARPGQIEPWLAAHAVLGLYASLLELARDRVLDGVSGPELAAELRRQGRRGLALLQFGLAGYAKRR
ncbi:TetR/AcrR family transcriptional regulator [Blastococcus sp. TF02-8]|uniref:TetR/AcrR family transcriptional regulator n=1 Tax=Blastococcus sp. TF02-8 TaxID=2250574 RepID=UPI000DEA0B2A|nr:TetR/AcrR family transcriptional regulator [Blastococcus sp. TF02-8]RBY97408.1 TetR/AcrR family transcriptional regulator [Blastococcus sp. TF02-8]